MNAPVDVTHIRIETDRLILRAWQETDLSDFYEYARVDGVGQMAGWEPHASPEVSRKILEKFIQGKKTFALELKGNGKVIGSLGLEAGRQTLGVPETFQGREIGYVLSKAYWGRGLMPEAVKAVIDYCFRELDFDFLTCGHFLRNAQSRRVIEKCGFQFLGQILYQAQTGAQEPTRLYVRYNPRKVTAPFDAETVELETERLILRPICESDLQGFHAIATTPEIADMNGWDCSESLENTRTFLERHIREKESLALVLKETGEMVGTFNFQSRDWALYPIDYSLRGREFGFDLLKPYWGRGLMPEALRAVTVYCFDVLGYDFVTCGHFLRNGQSRRCIEKCGFDFLFEDTLTLPTGRTERIRTYIRYNPNKEKQHV